MRALTPARAQKSGPFPSTPAELLGHIDDVHEHSWAFLAAGLVVLNRRRLTGEEAEAFDVPGWGPDRPLLVATEEAASGRPLFYETLLQLARYEKPLLVAALRSTRNRPHWSGATLQMQRRLWAHYPGNRAEGYGWIFRTAEWADNFEGFSVDDRPLDDAAYASPYSGPHDPFRLLDHSLDGWIGSKDDFSEHPMELDLLELYKLMARHSRILGEFGVKVAHEKPSRRESTRWTIEAPRWSMGDIDKIAARFWYVSRAHEAAPRALVGPGFTTLVLMSE